MAILTVLAVFVGQEAAHADSEDEIREVVRAYIQGADAQDVSRVASALRDDVSQVIRLPNGRLTSMDKAAYIGALEAKRIGGQTRQLTILWTDVSAGAVASVKARATSASLDFLYYINLVRAAEGWKIQSLVTNVETVPAEGTEP